MPVFDCCISLSMYFTKTSMQKLVNFIIFVYLNFLILNFSTVESLNSFLKNYGIFSFQYKIISRILIFVFKIKNSENSLHELKKLKIN